MAKAPKKRASVRAPKRPVKAATARRPPSAARPSTAKRPSRRAPRQKPRRTGREGNADLLARLSAALPPELEQLRKILGLKRGEGPDLIARKFREVAGNSFANATRKFDGACYHQILVDVADKLKPGLKWTALSVENSTVEQAEDRVYELALQRFEKFMAGLDEAKRREFQARFESDLLAAGLSGRVAAGAGAAAIAGSAGLLAASPVAMAVFYQGFFAGLYAGVFGPSALALIGGGALAAAPVALAGAALLLAMPAYKKSIPCAIAVVAIRRRLDAAAAMSQGVHP